MTDYKAKADAVLLSRGKKPAVRLDIKGKSESQIYDMLTALPKARAKDRE